MRWQARVEARIVAYVTACVLVACGIGFLAFAAYVALLDVASPPLAALLVAIALLLLAVAVLWGVRRAAARNRARHDAGRDDALDDLEGALGKYADPALREWVRRHPLRGTSTGLLLGIAAGYSRSTRRLLRDILAGIAAAEPDRERRRGKRTGR